MLNTIVSINQPAYLPWLGYFYRIAKSDVFIHLDHVQFEKNSMTNRNKIKSVNGVSLLTVPVQTKGKFGELCISELKIDSAQQWTKKHLSSIQQAYSKSDYFKEIFPFFEEIYRRKWEKLNDLTIHINNFLLEYIGITSKVMYSSKMDVSGSNSELVLNLCKEVNASKYLSGPFGKDYLEIDTFDKAGIEVEFVDFIHPSYSQLHGNFEPYLSILDLIFNHGKNSLEILMNK